MLWLLNLQLNPQAKHVSVSWDFARVWHYSTLGR